MTLDNPGYVKEGNVSNAAPACPKCGAPGMAWTTHPCVALTPPEPSQLFPRPGSMGDARIENQLNQLTLSLYDIEQRLKRIEALLERVVPTDSSEAS